MVTAWCAWGETQRATRTQRLAYEYYSTLTACRKGLWSRPGAPGKGCQSMA
jgi:hypothetical protein